MISVCLDDDFDVDALSRSVNNTVNRLLREGEAEIPQLGSVTAALVRLHLALLRRTGGIGPAGRMVVGDGVFEIHSGA